MTVNSNTAAAIGYLHECFESDHSQSELWNIFSTKVEQIMFNPVNALAIPDIYGDKVLPVIESYRREKTFRHFSYFIVGKQQSNRYGKSKVSTFCAPLFILEATLTKLEHAISDPSYQQVIDSSSIDVNPALLGLWQSDKVRQDSLADALISTWSNNASDDCGSDLNYRCDENDVASAIIKTLSDTNADLTITLKNAEFHDKSSFNKAFKGLKIGTYFLVPMNACAVIERSISTRGILDELSFLKESKQYSKPLQLSLDPSACSPQKKGKPADYNYIPGILSSAQKSALTCAAESELSLLIGPPGTGKSYTIACLALERFMQGESVLIVSRNEHAIDVIKEKITETFGLSQGSIMRAGTKDYHRQLKLNLEKILQEKQPEIHQANNLKKQLEQINNTISAAEILLDTRFKRAENEGLLLQNIESGKRSFNWLTQLRLWWSQRYLNKLGLLQTSLKTIQDLHKERDQLLAQSIDQSAEQKINHTLFHHRRQLTGFKSALSARTSSRQEKILSGLDFSILLESMPIWLCSLEGLHKTLPLTHELFDLVIIDEATQCDIASCLPALQRAKRAMVVGDPKQLRHISFLSKAKQQSILDKYDVDGPASEYTSLDINYRDHSLIDLAQRHIQHQSSIVMLNEHYRSVPEIIRFSNENFYQSRLRLMTEKPTLAARNAIQVINVENGKRTEGINTAEADAILNKLRALVLEQATVAAEYKLSIGVLSFFRAQAEYIQDEIFKHFNLDEIMAHKLRCGTPYAFQGEERDIMLISCGVDEDSVAGSFNYINRTDVFNVSITRARELQLVYLSCPKANLPEQSLLKKFIFSIDQAPSIPLSCEQDRHHDIKDLIQHLRADDYHVLLNYPVAGIDMDLVIMKDSEVLAVDLVGFVGEEADSFHLSRYKIFERAGLTIIPICVTSWRLKRLEVLASIKTTFKELKDKNTLGQLEGPKKLGLWMQLMAINPMLADTTRVIEDLLVALNAQPQLTLLKQIIQHYKKVLWVLTERLEPTELTFIRYSGASEQVYLAALDNFQQWSDISKLSGINTSAEQQGILNAYVSEINTSLLSLEKMSLKWGQAVTKSQLANSNLIEATSELDALNNRIEYYSDI
ncbi:MAG: superfamily I DNA and/or RNA helicase [Oleispira sp.]|jgi:superfamily I DNA and/or RNA helicase